MNPNSLSNDPHSSSQLKEESFSTFSLLQDFPSLDDETKFRQWLLERISTLAGRFSLCGLALLYCFARIILTYNFGAVDNATSAQTYGGVVSTILWAVLVIIVAFLPPTCKAAASAIRYFLYAFSIIGIVYNGFILKMNVTFSIGLFGLILSVLPFTFKYMLPFFITSILSLVITAASSTDKHESHKAIGDMFMFILLVVVIWEREYLLRRRWAAEQRRGPAILAAQRNATHDVRNALQEVLAIVELGSKETKESMLDNLKETKDNTVLRVRTILSRITNRLETSLRDGRNVVMDELSRLNPEIQPCSLSTIVCSDFALDPLVSVDVAADFPATVETDAEWLRTCLLNLVDNAKKHGPSGGKILVSLHWVATHGRIRVEVQDQGEGPTPAKARDIWRGQGRAGGIGIRAIMSYVDGLGGKYGNKGSTFFIEVPGGMTEKLHKMSTWTLAFVSAKAESIFVRDSHETSVWDIMTAGFYCTIIAIFYFLSAHSTDNLNNSNAFLFTGALIGLLWIFAFASIHFAKSRPVLRWWARILLCVIIVAIDLYLSLNVISLQLGAQYIYWGGNLTFSLDDTLQMKYMPGLALIALAITCAAPTLNIPIFMHMTCVFFILFINRLMVTIAAFWISYGYFFARSIHIGFIILSFRWVYKNEVLRRKKYVANFQKDALKRDYAIIELSARARAEEVQRESDRHATHQVSRCFETLLTAALKMAELSSSRQEQLIKPRQFSYQTLPSANSSKSDAYDKRFLQIFDKILEAKEHFVAMQIRTSHEVVSSTQNMNETLRIHGSQDEEEKGDEKDEKDEKNGVISQQQIVVNRCPEKSIPKILVVDDNTFCCEFIASQIRNLLGRETKCRVDCVGESTKTILNYMLSDHSIEYDLVLMDMQMPENSKSPYPMEEAGIMVTRKYKLERPNSKSKFLLLSGLGRDPYVVAKCKDAGFSPPFALGKPFDTKEMQCVLDNMYATGGHRSTGVEEEEEEAQQEEKKDIE